MSPTREACPVCGESFVFVVRQRIAYFQQGEFYRHVHYGLVYFHDDVEPPEGVFSGGEATA